MTDTPDLPQDKTPLDLIAELREKLEKAEARLAQLEAMAHTEHNLSPEVIEQLAANGAKKAVEHLQTLLKMGETLLNKA